MSRIIKSGAPQRLAAIHAVPSAETVVPWKPPSEEEERRGRLQARADALEFQLRERDAAIAKLRAEIDAAFERGKSQGHQSGLAAAERREAERLSLLENAMRQARDTLADNLVSLERLAALLARDCLDIILGDPDHRKELLAAIVVREAAKVEKFAIVAVTLSQEDFPDREALTSLAATAGVDESVVAVAGNMPSGGCTMTLRLGSIDIGLNQQWDVLRARLTELSAPELLS